MNTIDSLTSTAKSQGYHVQREQLVDILIKLYEGTNENFWLLRQKDPNYNDPRTDYLLGKRDAITDLIQYARTTMEQAWR